MQPTSSCLFLNRCYWPDFQATGQLLTELCEYLADDWDVTVLTGQPVFKNGDGDGFRKRGGNFRNGVRVERLKHFQVSPSRVRWRIANLASFTWAARRWLRRTSYRPDVMICETDPFFLPLVAAPAARRFGSKLVFYLQDIYPDIAIALGMMRENLMSHRLRHRLVDAYRQADRIVVLSDDMRDHLMQWGISGRKIDIVPNWVNCSDVYPARECNGFRHRQGWDDRFVVMHSGNMGMTQRLDRLIEAMNHPDIPDHLTLALVGNGGRRPDLASMVANAPVGSRMANHVEFLDYQPKSELANSLSSADLHVISMDERITGLMAPSKLYGILATGSPILAIVPPSCEVWRIVERERIGWCVRPGDDQGLAAALRDATAATESQRAAMSARARQLAELHYDREICCGDFEQVLRSLVAADPSGSRIGSRSVAPSIQLTSGSGPLDSFKGEPSESSLR